MSAAKDAAHIDKTDSPLVRVGTGAKGLFLFLQSQTGGEFYGNHR